MRRARIVAFAPGLALASLAMLAAPRAASAHGFGQTFDLPIPLWLYLFGAGAAVLVSFVPVSLLTGSKEDARAPFRYPRFDLFGIKALRMVLNNGAFLFCLRLISVALFALIIAAGLFGEQDAGLNIAPTAIWILWWVGLSFFTALVGNVWPLVNPWRILFEWAERLASVLGARNLQVGEAYPKRWGVWPAVFLYAAFVWVENVFSGSATPAYLAVFALNYSVLTWGGMVIYGKETWLRNAEVFTVFFGLLARIAPTEIRVKSDRWCEECPEECALEEGCVNCRACFVAAPADQRELCLRPPLVGLGRLEPVPPGGVFFVLLVLAGVAFDGLLETPAWLELRSVLPLSRTIGLLVLPLLFLVVYLAFVWMSRLAGGGEGPLRRYTAGYVFSLVPIAFAYQVAHYYTLLLIQGQAIYRHVSDPFGWGWDLFGTADFTVNAGVVGARFVWYSQVALIVVGHVAAVYLAHTVALRLFKDQRRAAWSQVPMLILMVAYTVFSLWILAQPIVGD